MDYATQKHDGERRVWKTSPTTPPGVVAAFPLSPAGELAYALFVAGLRAGPNTLYDTQVGRFVVPATIWPDVTDERRAELRANAGQHIGRALRPVPPTPDDAPREWSLDSRTMRPRYRRAWWQFWKPRRGAARVTIKETSPCN